MTGYVMFTVLPTILALAITSYLLFARFNVAYRERVLKKIKSHYGEDSLVHSAYGTRSLLAWVFIALFFVSSTALDLFENDYGSRALVTYIKSVILVIALSGSVYWILSSFKKR